MTRLRRADLTDEICEAENYLTMSCVPVEEQKRRIAASKQGRSKNTTDGARAERSKRAPAPDAAKGIRVSEIAGRVAALDKTIRETPTGRAAGRSRPLTTAQERLAQKLSTAIADNVVSYENMPPSVQESMDSAIAATRAASRAPPSVISAAKSMAARDSKRRYEKMFKA